MAGEFFKMRGIVKSYRMGDEEQVVLKGIDLDIQPGEFLSILGPSGSGKTCFSKYSTFRRTEKESLWSF